MTIELSEIDGIPYELQTSANDYDYGKYYVKVMPRTDLDERDEDYEICLNYDQCLELARALQFMANEIKPKDN